MASVLPKSLLRSSAVWDTSQKAFWEHLRTFQSTTNIPRCFSVCTRSSVQSESDAILRPGRRITNVEPSARLAFNSASTPRCTLRTKNFHRCQKRGIRTVVPKTFAPSSKSIENVLAGNNCEYMHGHTSFVTKCFACHGKEGSKEGNKLTLFVNEVTGSYVCKDCGVSGTWNELRDNLGHRNRTRMSDGETDSKETEKEAEQQYELANNSQLIIDLPEGQRQLLCKKFGIEKISKKTLEKYLVTIGKHKYATDDVDFTDQSSLILPVFDIARKSLIGAKFLSSNRNGVSELNPRGCQGLFGWHTIDSTEKKVVLTASELDALAVFEATGIPSMAIPNGTTTLPPEVLPQLEQFNHVVLWFGKDVKSRQAVTQFSRKLGMERCFFIRNFEGGAENVGGPLEALQQGVDMESVITKAFPVSHPEILTFNQFLSVPIPTGIRESRLRFAVHYLRKIDEILRDDLFTEMTNSEEAAGTKWTRFPLVNSILKGHRRGELTIFTGPTGAGKTTLLSELSLDLSCQGVSTLWGSFEIRNVRLLRTIMNQLSGLDMESNLDQYDRWASKLDSLPLYFMDFYGSQSLHTVLETMSHAAYVYDIEHVIIDNLQFMTDDQGYGRFDETFIRMNNALAAFRKFATKKNVHVTLVVHPRKENDHVELQTASVFGTAKATQEADNVLILQNGKGGGKYLEVTKNRFDGTLGKIPLTFHKSSLTLSGFYRNEKTKEAAFVSKSDFLNSPF